MKIAENWKDEGQFLFCANDLYAQHLAACVVSLLENSSLKHHHICVVGKFEDAAVAEKLNQVVDGYKNCSLRIINFLPPDDLKLPTRIHYTKDIFTRLWVEEFFDETVERVLYLDSDMIVTRDIADLWRMDLHGKLFAATDIPGSDRGEYLSIPEEYQYFNSGVLLFDLPRWRQEKALSQIVNYIEENAERLIDPDQDALNACYYNNRHMLDVTWNVISPFTRSTSGLPYSKEELREIVDIAHIVHFNGQSKPWHYMNDHPYKSHYWKYVNMTPWRGAEEIGKSFPNLLKKIYNNVMPSALREWLWKLRGRGA